MGSLFITREAKQHPKPIINFIRVSDSVLCIHVCSMLNDFTLFDTATTSDYVWHLLFQLCDKKWRMFLLVFLQITYLCLTNVFLIYIFTTSYTTVYQFSTLGRSTTAQELLHFGFTSILIMIEYFTFQNIKTISWRQYLSVRYYSINLKMVSF